MKKLYIIHAYFRLLLAFFFFLGAILCAPQLIAQEKLFTQFDYNPLVINPANTGNFIGDWRIAGYLRNQQLFAGDFRTTSLSYDRQLYILNQKIGAGLYVMNDESGTGAKKLIYNKIYASLAYQAMVGNNQIGFGLQAGYAIGSYPDYSIWDRKTGGFNLPSGEPDSYGQSNFFDLNIGLNYKTSLGVFEPEIGVSAMHLNNPDKSFDKDGSGKEAMALLGTFVLKTNINDHIYVTPKFLLLNNAGQNGTVAGLEGGYRVVGRSQVKRIFGGAYMRNGLIIENKALTFQAGATVNRIDIVLNYEMASSATSNSGSLGAFEVSFIYKSISTVLNSYSIPCERY